VNGTGIANESAILCYKCTYVLRKNLQLNAPRHLNMSPGLHNLNK